MLRLLLGLLIVWYELDSLWAVAAFTTVVILTEALNGAGLSNHTYTAISIVVQSVVGPLVALTLRYFHNRDIISVERCKAEVITTGAQSLRALFLLVLGLGAYQRQIVDDRTHAFPQGILLSAALLYATAIACEVAIHHGRTMLSRSARDQLFPQEREGQTVLLVYVCWMVIAVDLLVWELRPMWFFAVLAGTLAALWLGSEAFDWMITVPDRLTESSVQR
jgi:tetrahydromethanopterin S-methyltransferase subunit C